MVDRYLMHYGITGQKWGERRYQYDDGRLTPEGKIRYGKGNPKDSALDKHFFKSRNKKLRRYQNPNGSLTSKGKRRFSKLINANEEYEKMKSISDVHNKKMWDYMKKNKIKSKEDIQNQYIDDQEFKKYVDISDTNRNKEKLYADKYLKEYRKVSTSNFDSLTLFGNETVDVIMNEYYKYKIKGG